MKELSLAEMAVQLIEADLIVRTNATAALERVAVKVEETAKDEIGEYQPAVGPFPAWAELAESTQEDRRRLGYTPNDPLLRSGELRDSISHEVHDLEAVVGSPSDIALWQEMGTSKMPPRPFLGPAVVRNEPAIVKELGGAVVAGISGRKSVDPALGYDREVAASS